MMGEANDRRSELLRQNDELRAKAAKTEELEARYIEVMEDMKAWEGAKPMRVLDPRLIRRGPLANRDTVNFSGDEFTAFKQEITEAGGNVVPIKVRTIAIFDGYAYELIYGHRRHQAALETGMPLLAIVDNLDDKAAYEEMERENRGHTKPSPWEQGLSYDRALKTGLYASARQCAVALGVDPSNLAKSLTLANLPTEVIRAFHSPLAIQLRWGTALKGAIDAGSERVILRATELQALVPRLSPKQVLDELVAASQAAVGRKSAAMVPEPHPSTMHLLGHDGREVARLRHNKTRTELVVLTPLSLERQRRLTELVARFLDAKVS
jgi:ParB family chromosome partitioning protein